MRTYYECDIISIGIIITRSEKLNRVFRELGVLTKYRASTTWLENLRLVWIPGVMADVQVLPWLTSAAVID